MQGLLKSQGAEADEKGLLRGLLIAAQGAPSTQFLSSFNARNPRSAECPCSSNV